MRLNFISQIQSNMKKSTVISTKRASSNILDGSYVSVFKGRSLNFEDLREYVPGDDIKDIDWKATARSRTTLVREYVAEKKHNIMFIMDTNKRMLGHSAQMVEKREIALYAAGTLAYLVSRNGDFVSATFSTEKSLDHYPFKTGLMNIEKFLESYYQNCNYKNDSDINKSLDYIMRHFRRRMIIVIITDMKGTLSISEQTLKRLKVLHDVLLVNVSDVDASGKDVFDVEQNNYLPDFFTKSKRLIRKEEKKRQELKEEFQTKLKRAGIANSTIDTTERIDIKLTELLNKHKLEMR